MKLALQRRAQREAEAEADKTERDNNVGFSRYACSVDQRLAHKDINALVFQRVASDNLTSRAGMRSLGINSTKLELIRRWTLWRYVHHRAEAWQNALSGFLAAVCVCPCKSSGTRHSSKSAATCQGRPAMMCK